MFTPMELTRSSANKKGGSLSCAPLFWLAELLLVFTRDRHRLRAGQVVGGVNCTVIVQCAFCASISPEARQVLFPPALGRRAYSEAPLPDIDGVGLKLKAAAPSLVIVTDRP